MKDINTKINHTSSMNQANNPKNASQTVASVPRCLPGISPHGPLQSPRPTNNHSALKGSRLAVLVLPHDSVFLFSRIFLKIVFLVFLAARVVSTTIFSTRLLFCDRGLCKQAWVIHSLQNEN